MNCCTAGRRRLRALPISSWDTRININISLAPPKAGMYVCHASCLPQLLQSSLLHRAAAAAAGQPLGRAHAPQGATTPLLPVTTSPSPPSRAYLGTTPYANLDFLPLLEAQVDLRHRGSRHPPISAGVAATLPVLLKLSAPLNVPTRVNGSRTRQTGGDQVWVIRARQVAIRSGLYHKASV